ncbi:hypothetical protein AB0M22_45015 [Nocardia sp. NPDC051756]|uniref:hypothetical protein n=1 Tax=Nocardia sp. NPDC051756 TaxID=3154751 RepID=UPI003428E088
MGTHDAINAANAEAARKAGWPELTGTAKQIGWAHTVRKDKMDEFEATPMPEAEKTRWREILLRELRAGAWIDSLSSPWQALAIINLTTEEHADLLAGQFAGS